MNARRATTLALAAAALAAGLAYGDAAHGAAPLTRVRITAPAPAENALAVTSLDATVRLLARSTGEEVDPAGLVLARVGEAPYLPDRPVLDPAALAAGAVVVRNPGEAVLMVAAPGMKPARLRLTVAPSAPLVLAASVPATVRTGSVITLRGYRLDDPSVVASVRGRAVQTVYRDSATLVVRPVAMGDGSAACDMPARATLDITGADLHAGVAPPALRIERPGELAIAPGETIYLTRQQMEDCVMLPAPTAGVDRTLYAFVTVDTAWTLPEYESTAPYAAPISVPIAVTRLSDPVGAPPVAPLPFGPQLAALAGAGPDGEPGFRVLGAPPDSTTAGFGVMYRDVPLAVADTFVTVLTDLGAVHPPRPARVLDVVDDYVVVAGWNDLGDEEIASLQTRLPMVRSAIETFLERSDAMYQDVFGVGRPRTLYKHEQVILILESQVANASAQRLMIIPIGGEARSDLEGFYLTFAHEMAHLYHFAHRDEREAGTPGGMTDGGTTSLWKAWNIEGIADYMMAHAGAAYRGLAFLPEKAPVYDDGIYRGLRGRGNWSCGYSGMAALLRRFDAALIDAGVTPEEARRRVVQAATAGWGAGLAREPDTSGVCGLHCLMAQAFGETSIGDVLLRLYLDDLVNDAFAHPLYNNPTTYNPLGLFEGRSMGSRTWGSRLRPSGAAVNITVPDTDGGAYRLTQARDNDSERWAVFRIPDGALPDR